MNGIDALLAPLDTPGAYLRNAAVGKFDWLNPFSSEGRATGGDVLRKWGAPIDKEDTWSNLAPRIGIEMLLDPLNVAGGYGLIKKGLQRAAVKNANFKLLENIRHVPSSAGEAIAPWQMSRKQFEDTGQRVLHGTPRKFDQFGQHATNRYGAKADKFYFTDRADVADRFAHRPDSFRQVDIDKFVGDDLSAADRTDSALLHELESAIGKQLATGSKLAYTHPDTGQLKFTTSVTEAMPEIIGDGDVRLYRPWAAPRVIDTTIYGAQLDLTSPATTPSSLAAFLRLRGDAWRPGQPLSFAHEYSKPLVEWMRKHHFGRAVVNDAYESGFKSHLALPEYIGYGRDPHRDFVAGAMRDNVAVSPEALQSYPELMPVKMPIPRLGRDIGALLGYNALVQPPRRRAGGIEALLEQPQDTD